MAKSPDRPPHHDVDTDSLPWAASPGSHEPLEGATAAVEGFNEEPTSATEAIGGGSHRLGRSRHRAGGGDDAVTRIEALEAAIVTRPLAALVIAATAGFLAARLLRR